MELLVMKLLVMELLAMEPLMMEPLVIQSLANAASPLHIGAIQLSAERNDCPEQGNHVTGRD